MIELGFVWFTQTFGACPAIPLKTLIFLKIQVNHTLSRVRVLLGDFEMTG
jgi:hypothetical protein